MVVAVNQPREKKGGMLGDLVQAVSLASNIYGMKIDHDKLALLEQQAANEKDMNSQKAIADLYTKYEPVSQEKAIPNFKPYGVELADNQGLALRMPKEQQGLTTPLQAAQLKKIEAETAAIKYKGFSQPEKPSVGQIAIDKSFAKDYNDYVLGGGSSDVAKGINQLKEARENLNTTNATGGFVGIMPKGVRDIVTPEGAAIQDTVEEVVQRNMRQILGAQFTEKEGAKLIARSYNPRLSEQENAKRLDRLIVQMEQAASSKEEAIKYFEENGTLKGFKGKVYTNANQFMNDFEKQSPKGNSGEAIAAPASKPETIMQNGVLYKLNRTNGKYE